MAGSAAHSHRYCLRCLDGIGAAGTFLVGVLYYGDPTSVARYFGVALIVAGVITLKLAH